MRKLSLLAAVVLLSSAWVLAQNSTPPSSSQQSPSSAPTAQQPSQSDPAQGSEHNGQSIEGCLAGSAGSWTLTDASGKTYQLAGDTAKLGEHVGHQIRVTGTQEGASATATAGATSSSPTFTVKKVKMISATCSNK